MRAWRKVVAAGLCLCLLTPPPGWGPLLRAADPQPADPTKVNVTPKEVMAYLEKHHAFDGPNAALRQFVGTENFITPYGAVLYRSLLSQPNPDEEVAGMQDAFKALLKSGPYTEKKGAAFNKQVQRYMDKFGGLPEPTDMGAEDTFQIGTLREAMMTGAAVIDAPKAEFSQVDLPNNQGWEFWDKDGLAFKLNKNKVTVYNRELQKMQRELNKNRPQQAPFIPETGRYNAQMFETSYWRLKLQADQIVLATRLDRMVGMAELLGEQKKDQVFFDPNDPGKVNAVFEAELIKKAKAKTYTHKGRTYSVFDIAQAKTKVRMAYLDKANQGVDYFRTEMEKLKGASSITDSQVKSMEMSEQYVMRYLSLAFLEAQKYAVRSQMERLNADSPDSKMVAESLKSMPLDGDGKTRYREEGAKLLSRLQRLLAVLGQTEDVLFKTDYASNLDLVQAALNSSQKELGEIGTNYEIFTTVPGMLLALSSQSGTWKPRFNGSWDPRKWEWGVWHRAAADTRVAGSKYAKGLDEVNRSLQGVDCQIFDPQSGSTSTAHVDYLAIAKKVAAGDFWSARRFITALNPDAVYQRPTMSLSGETPKINDAARLAAALRVTRETVAEVAEVNRWVDMAGNLITWSVAVGLGAPILRKGLAIVETYANKMDLQLIAALAEQARLRLASLEPSAERLGARSALGAYVKASAYRTWTFGVRQVVFTGLSGTISGVATALGDAADRLPFKLNLGIVKLGEGNSNFKDPGDAFLQGAAGGMQWANQSFHPALGYIGLPSSYFEGGPFAGLTRTLGERGAFGSIKQGVQTVVNRFRGISAEALAEEATARAASQITTEVATKSFGAKVFEYALKKPVVFAGGMADNLAKYALFSKYTGELAKKVSWYWNHDEADVNWEGQSAEDKALGLSTIAGLERRIKRSEHAGAYVSELPLWLAIPVFPAKYEVAAQGYQRSVQGEQEYHKAGRDAELANAAADQTVLPMIGKNKPPLAQRIFQYTAGAAKDGEATFLVTKDIKRRAISRELKKYVSGGRKEGALGEVNPEEFLKISRSNPDERKMIGELYNSDDVRNEARKLCVEALAKNPTLAKDILGAKPGSDVPGFGRVTPGVQREIAAMMLDELPRGVKVTPEVQALAESFIQMYLKSNGLGKPGGPAEQMLKRVAANTHETPAQVEALSALLKEMNQTVAKWEVDVSLQATKTKYPELAKEFYKGVKAKFESGALTKEQFEAVEGMFKLIEAQEARFGSFNNVSTTHKLINEELSALRLQYESSPGVLKIIDGFTTKLNAWAERVPSEARATTAADAAPFKEMLSGGRDPGGVRIPGFKDDIAAALKARLISPEEAVALREVVTRDMAGAPWILHDSKGTSLSGWRPGQFVTYFDALTKVVEMGKGGAPIRGFMRLTTGGGKTLLAFEGLLPIAEADARAHNMKVGFFTVQSNLDAQAQLEWRSLRKVGSKLEFDTYEGLKSKIAEAKNKGQKYVDTIWILGDEMDGAALQPALTLGETTGRIGRKNSVYERMEQLNTRMEQLLQRDAVKLSEQVKTQARQAQSVIDGLDVKTAEARAARTATEKLIKAAEQLSTASSPEMRLKAQQAIRSYLSELSSAMSAPSLTNFPESLSRIFAKNDQLQSAVESLSAGATPDQLGKVRELLVEQQKLLSSKDLASCEQAKLLRRSTGELLSKLAKPPEGADLAAVLKDAVNAQQGVLRSTARIPDAAKGSVQSAATRISGLLDQGMAVDAAGRQALAQEVAENLARQKNLLPLVEGEAGARVENLRLEARGLRENAQARLETIKRKMAAVEAQMAGSKEGGGELAAQKGALESEMRLAQREIALAQRFEGGQFGRAQRLIEKIFELHEQYPAQQAKLEQTGGAPKTLEGYVKRVTDLGELLRRAADLTEKISAAKEPGQAASLRSSLDSVQSQADVLSSKISRSLQSEKEFAGLRKGQAGASPEVAQLFELGQRMTALKSGLLEAAKSGKPAAGLATELQALQVQTEGLKAGRVQARDQGRLESAQTELSALRQGLNPKQNTALDAYQADVAKLYDVGHRMAAVDEKVLEAAKAGKPMQPLQKELATLQVEADAVQSSLAKARDLARPRISAADLKAVHSQFGENSQDILDLMKKGDAESQAAALRLLEGRKTLLDAYAGSENPLYQLYQKMKADAFSVARSPIWERNETEVAKKAAEKSKTLIAGSAEELGQGLQSVEGLAKTGESEAAAKLRQQAETLLRQQSQKWQELSGREPGDRQTTLKNMGEAMDVASQHAGQRERFLKSLRAAQPGLEAPFVERLEAVFKSAELRETALKTGVDVQMRSVQMTQDKAVKLYGERIDGPGFGRFSLSVAGQVASHPVEYLVKPVVKLLGADVQIRPMDIPIEKVGLTRLYAWKMMKEILSDPLMPAGQRDMLFANAFTSFMSPTQYSAEWSVWPPKFSFGRKSSWVRQEFLNLVQGYHDDYATVRLDNITHKTNVIHNGQWFETMDNPTRRFWELEYGTDLTLPYTHKALSTIKDVTSNKKTRMFALSATAGEKYIAHLGESDIAIGGSGAKKPSSVSVDVREGEGGKVGGAAEAVARVAESSRKLVSFRTGEVLAPEANAPAEVRAYLESSGLGKKDSQVLELSSLPEGPVRDYFSMLRGRQPSSTGLLVISLPDTRALKAMRKFLVRTGRVQESEIAQVFSDAEYLRLNRPQANVHEQMNLDAMKAGKVKVLLLDTRVGGRGLDLEYKGDKGDPRPEAFKGYTNYEMLVMDPQKMSAVHLLQAEGRIDVGRVLLNAPRKFRLMMDVKTLQKDYVFEDMFRNNELFVGLRNDAGVREFARAESSRLGRTVEVDWAMLDSYIKQAEIKRLDAFRTDPGLLEFAAAKKRAVDLSLVRDYVLSREAAAKKSGDAAELTWVSQNNMPERYDQVLNETLERRQQLIEEDQLRQSSVLQDKPISNPKLRWLDQLQRGR